MPILPPVVKQISSDNFGLVIAYLLPGFVTLWGIRPFSTSVDAWFGSSGTTAPTVGEFFYVTLASTATGLIVSTIRWALIDQLYHRTGIPEPAWDFGKLPAALAAFDSHIQDHYRYYQFHANMLVAIAFSYGAQLIAHHRWPGQDGWKIDVAVACLLLVLVLGSRDTLRKYYRRTAAILPARRRRQG